MKKNKFRKFVILLAIATVVSYLSVFVSPVVFWPIGLVNYLIPALIFTQILLLIWTLMRDRKLALIPFLTLITGSYFIDNTFNLPLRRLGDFDIEILSFNARYFRERRDYSRFNHETIRWAVNENSDIKCFQEFSAYPYVEKTDIVNRMKSRGYFAHAVAFKKENARQFPGLAIFSRFPIVNKGTIILNKNSINNCIFADIKINKDTVRIYNFHLKSMGLHLYELKDPGKFQNASKRMVRKLGSASSKRALELNIILAHIEQCPYPFVLACDFNELIYGNNYYRVRKRAENTFEEVGNGFGFTFNSVLFFIRIDHQFFSEGLEAVKFEVIRKIKSSDHFPVRGYYQIK